MKGDFSRDTFDPKRHYRRVLTQQGRVDVDADANEQVAIDLHVDEVTTYDVVGPSGVPLALLPDGTPSGGFAIALAAGGGDLTVSPGRMYVEGVLCENHATDVTLLKQPDLPPAAITPPLASMAAGTYAIYLDVWERHLTALDDPLIREKALGGPDTATRTKTVWQVRAVQVDAAATCATAAKPYRRDPSKAGKMAAQTGAPSVDPLPCILPPESGYRSLENQLYRVEIHKPGGFGTATFKWSRENGSVVTAVVAPPNSNATTVPGPTFNVSSLGRDAETGFTGQLDWVEVLDDKDELGVGAGTLLQVDSVHPDVLTITTKTSPPAPLDLKLHPKLRRWEQSGSGLGNGIAIANGNPITLEQGIQVAFTNGDFRVGDYWLIPARTATDQEFGTIEWPLDSSQKPLALPPRGIVHRYAPLAIVTFTGGKFTKVVEDCRPPFDDLVELTKRKFLSCCTVSIAPADLTNTTLQALIDPFKNRPAVSVCLAPGDYPLTQPLNLGSEHSNFTIEASPGGATLRVKPGSESAFPQGLITIANAANVTLSGLTIQLPPPPAGTPATQTYVSVGIRPAGCNQLTIEGCDFKFPPAPNANITAIGIFAGANCVGLQVLDNRFEGTTNISGTAGGFQVGFDIYPFTLPAASGSTAQFVDAWLHDALFRDNFFDSLTFAMFSYTNCGLVEVESNTVQNCLNGFWFITFPMLASANDLSKVTVDQTNVNAATNFNNALYYALADPRVQMASSVLRSFALPPKFDLSTAQTLSATRNTAGDISVAQSLFDGISLTSSVAGVAVGVATAPTAAGAPITGAAAVRTAAAPLVAPLTGAAAVTQPAGTAAPTAPTATPTPTPPTSTPPTGAAPTGTVAIGLNRITLSDQPLVLQTHPLLSVQPLPPSVVTLNNNLSLFEKQAFLIPFVRSIPMGVHLSDNDVNVQVAGGIPGLGLLVASQTTDDRDAVNVSGNTFVGANSDVPIAMIAAVSRNTVTGNVMLNEGKPTFSPIKSLWVFPRSVTSSGSSAKILSSAVTGNVFRGGPYLPRDPAAQPPLDTWNSFNSIS